MRIILLFESIEESGHNIHLNISPSTLHLEICLFSYPHFFLSDTSLIVMEKHKDKNCSPSHNTHLNVAIYPGVGSFSMRVTRYSANFCAR